MKKMGGKTCGEGSHKLPTKKVKHVKGGDSIQKATNRVKKNKNNS